MWAAYCQMEGIEAINCYHAAKRVPIQDCFERLHRGIYLLVLSILLDYSKVSGKHADSLDYVWDFYQHRFNSALLRAIRDRVLAIWCVQCIPLLSWLWEIWGLHSFWWSKELLFISSTADLFHSVKSHCLSCSV